MGRGQWENMIPKFSCSWLITHATSQIAEIWLFATGMPSYLMYFSLSCKAQVLRDNMLCIETVQCFWILSDS